MRRLAVVATLLAARVAVAQPADVPAQIKLVETQPADMDKSAWKEKRRDAARRLAQSKDKRAVPVLIKLVETENFDIIGEIAIEGLGNLGDPSAVPALQKAANDNTRDKSTRELAKKALAKLGASADIKTGGGTPPPPDAGKTGGGTTATGGGTAVTTTTGGTTEPPPPDDGAGAGAAAGAAATFTSR